MKTIAIISARMGSTRLPGKTLMPIMGKSIFSLQIERIKTLKHIDEIWLATSTSKLNEPLISEAEILGIKFHAGDEDSILKRFIDIIEISQPDKVIRFCGDNPLIDVTTAQRQIDELIKHDLDYCCVADLNIQLGMVECFSKKALKDEMKSLSTNDKMRHESIGIWVKENAYRFKTVAIAPDEKLNKAPYRLTVDFAEDFELNKLVYQNLSNNDFNVVIDFNEVIEFLDKNPDIAHINDHCKPNSSSSLWQDLTANIARI